MLHGHHSYREPEADLALTLTGHQRLKVGQVEHTAVSQVVGPRGCKREKSVFMGPERHGGQFMGTDRHGSNTGHAGWWGGQTSSLSLFPLAIFQLLDSHPALYSLPSS